MRSFASDEPTRLAEIVSPLFADQAAGWSTHLSDGGKVNLLIGANAQDDCAVFQIRGDQELVLGSDYVRGVGFRLYELGHLNNYDIGYYLAMANFSDIAAMGAQPIALLSVIRYPRELSDNDFKSVIHGIREACAKVGAPNVGGDIGTAERLILSASAVGVVEPGRSLLRSGARPGDRLCVSGYTGIAAAAQRYFGQTNLEGMRIASDKETELLAAWKRPRALVDYGRCLSASGVVTSCQDSSDGLKAGIQSIAALSQVGFVVDEDALPIADVVAEVAQLRDSQLTSLVLGDSVDFQLIFTVAPGDVTALCERLRTNDFDLFEIGTAIETPEVRLRRGDGSLDELPGKAWRHGN
jgi:thiamine-monophosphate kinase